METLDSYLRRIPVRNKDIALIGPNFHVQDDPSPLFFASYAKAGRLYIIDRAPRWTPESHGDIYKYMKDFGAATDRGVKAIRPAVIIRDVTLKKTGEQLENRFDLIFDKNTFKCIVNEHAARSRTGKFIYPAKKVVDVYGKMLKSGGKMIFAYADGFEDHGYHVLDQLLSNDDRFHVTRESGLLDLFEIRSFDRKKLDQFGRKDIWNHEFCTKLRLNAQGQLWLGSKYPHHIISANKR